MMGNMGQIRGLNLHSTMYLLNHVWNGSDFVIDLYLHSTMYLLNRYQEIYN